MLSDNNIFIEDIMGGQKLIKKIGNKIKFLAITLTSY